MRINTILNRYLLLELWPPFGVNLFFFTFVFLMARMLDIMDMIVNYQASPLVFIRLLFYLMPSFLEYVVPMSVMMAVLLTFLRMSGDNEIVALKSCGIHPNRFLVPVVLFCLAGCALTAFITIKGLAWGYNSYYQLSTRIAKSHIQAIIKERTFIDSFDGVVLYINKMDTRAKKMIDIFIQDQRNQSMHNTITAPRADVIAHPDSPVLMLTLYDGSINQVDLRNHSAQTIQFEKYEMKLDLKEMMEQGSGRPTNLKMMSIGQLRQVIAETKPTDRRHYKAMLKYYEKFSLPFACFALGILAIPLGMESRTSRRSMGIVIGIVLFLLYYIMLLAGWSLGETGRYHPMLGMWTPNLLLGGLGIFLYWRAARDRPLVPHNWPAAFRLRRRLEERRNSCKPSRS